MASEYLLALDYRSLFLCAAFKTASHAETAIDAAGKHADECLLCYVLLGHSQKMNKEAVLCQTSRISVTVLELFDV